MESKIKLFQEQLRRLIFQTHAPCKTLCHVNEYNSYVQTTPDKSRAALKKITCETKMSGRRKADRNQEQQRSQSMGGGRETTREFIY